MKRDGDMISLDSTHKTCTYQPNKFCYLYTIVARCNDTGKGKPLVWMFTNSESQYPIRYWLEWLKNEHGYIPKGIMIDNSNTEIAAINNTYNQISVSSVIDDEMADPNAGVIQNDSDNEEDEENDVDENSEGIEAVGEEHAEFNSNVKIYLCNWHIMKAWKANILTKLTAKTSSPKKTTKEKKAKRDEALEMLTNLMGAPSPRDFNLRWSDFRLWALDNEEEWESIELFRYMQDSYYHKKRKWCMAFRRVSTKYNKRKHN